MDEKNILDMDAVGLKKAFEKKELTPSTAVEVYISHQKKINPKLNLVVEQRYEKARREAAEHTRAYENGTADGRLAGIPMSIKEAYDVEGMHTTGGMVSNKDNIAEQDAKAVELLKKEGAVVLCKTNTPTLCFCQETDNNLFGRSNNPWNPDYTTGGSSGGEAGLMAVGGAAAGLGSDIGGSIRMPSHFNGVVGFKPGAFGFPVDGHFPTPTVERQLKMLGFGPIVKSVRDAARIYAIIFSDFTEPGSYDLPENLKVITFDSFGKTNCTSETVKTREKAEKALSDAGAAIDTAIPVLMKDVALIWQLIMSEDKSRGMIETAYPGSRYGFFWDFVRSKLNMSTRHHPFLSWAFFATNLFPPSTAKLEWIDRSIQKGHDELKNILGDNGCIVIPSYPSPSKPHGKVYREIFHVAKTFLKVMPFTALANVYGLPAIIVPCGQSADGLPIGLQVVGLPGNEALIFKVARFLEQNLRGYLRCSFYD